MTLAETRALFTPLDADHLLPHPVVVLDTETTGFPACRKGGHIDALIVCALARAGHRPWR